MVANKQEHAKSLFDHRSLCYDGLEWVRDDEGLRAFADLAKPKATDVHLDLATGTGAVAERLAPRVCIVVGLDLSFGMLRSSSARLGPRVQAAAEQLPFSEDTFDLTTCRNGLHHFYSPDVGLSEIRRVTKMTGRIVISESLVPDGPIRHLWRSIMEIKDTGRHPDMYFTAEEFTNYLERHGLPVRSVRLFSRPFSLANWLENGCVDLERRTMILALLNRLTERQKRDLRMSTRDGDIWLLRRTATALTGCAV
jgi:ubiquinone/menaquinone biosynthesis C-methylase UbiE